MAAACCGDSAFTWMPCPCVSTARLAVQRLSIALVEPYAEPARAGAVCGNGGPGGISADCELMLRIAPVPRSRMPGSTCWASNHADQLFTSWTFWSCASVQSSNGL